MKFELKLKNKEVNFEADVEHLVEKGMDQRENRREKEPGYLVKREERRKDEELKQKRKTRYQIRQEEKRKTEELRQKRKTRYQIRQEEKRKNKELQQKQRLQWTLIMGGVSYFA